MTVSWTAATEIAFGLVLRKQLDPIHLPPEQVASPYDGMLGLLKQGKTEEDLIEVYGLEYVQSAYDAADTVEGTPFDYLKVLAKAYRRDQQATILERTAKNIRKGADVTIADLYDAFPDPRTEDEDEYTPMGEVEIKGSGSHPHRLGANRSAPGIQT